MASNKGKNSSKKVTKDIEVKSNDIDEKIEAKQEEKKEIEPKSNVNEVKVRKVRKKASNNIKDIKQENKIETKEPIVEKKDDSNVLKEIMKSADEADKNGKNIKVKQEDKDKIKSKKEEINKPEEKKTGIVKKDSIELLEKEIKEKNNKKKFALLNIVLFLVLIFIFSSVFALINQNSNKIVKGIKIRDIDVSSLTKDEAISKVTEAIELEFM